LVARRSSVADRVGWMRRPLRLLPHVVRPLGCLPPAALLVLVNQMGDPAGPRQQSQTG